MGDTPPRLQNHLLLAEALLRGVGDEVVSLQQLLAEVRAEIGPLLKDRSAPPPDDVHALRREVEQLRQGLASRAIIERAKGMVMHAWSLSESQAFDFLKDVSQRRHRKLRDVAEEITHAELPPRLPQPAGDRGGRSRAADPAKRPRTR